MQRGENRPVESKAKGVKSVVIDGIPYFPETRRQAAIGVGITTHNRHDVLAETLAAFDKFSPEIPVVIVDDGSTEPVASLCSGHVVRHDEPLGIPAAKNRCLHELMKLGVEHLFLFDDDTKPNDEGWWEPYANGREPHYQYCWTKFATNGKPVPKMDVLYQDADLVAYGWSMGCMLYVHADVVRAVGGMRTEFGRGMEEHGEWSQRIHNAGFTTFAHQDVPNSSKLIWAADEYGAVTRSFDWKDRSELLKRNEEIRLKYADDASFVPYQSAERNAVITTYLTSGTDLQRGVKMPDDPKVLDPLIDSCKGHNIVLIHDLPVVPFVAESVGIVPHLEAYQQRWLSEWQYLRSNPEIEFAWLVDATDVRMLNNPFPHMQRGVLYCGWEAQIVGCAWMRDHAPSYGDWVEANKDRMLLNCGVVGGDRATLMWLCQRMTDLWIEGTRKDPLEEMTYFNMAAYEHPNMITGTRVTTIFKSGKTADPVSFWAHK